jgi:hypothetical protein
MRVWGQRYNRDLQRYNLALRMIAHEARTHTICDWTGLPVSGTCISPTFTTRSRQSAGVVGPLLRAWRSFLNLRVVAVKPPRWLGSATCWMSSRMKSCEIRDVSCPASVGAEAVRRL